jgi:hypothetical protein
MGIVTMNPVFENSEMKLKKSLKIDFVFLLWRDTSIFTAPRL